MVIGCSPQQKFAVNQHNITTEQEIVVPPPTPPLSTPQTQQPRLSSNNINSTNPAQEVPSTESSSCSALASEKETASLWGRTESKDSSASSSELLTQKSEMRESRHVRVDGLPENLSSERISSFFATFGRVQKVTHTSNSNSSTFPVIVSFMDVRTAQKVCEQSEERKLDGHTFRTYFHEPAASSTAPLKKTLSASPLVRSTDSSESVSRDESGKAILRPSSAASQSSTDSSTEKRRLSVNTAVDQATPPTVTKPSPSSVPMPNSVAPPTSLQTAQNRVNAPLRKPDIKARGFDSSPLQPITGGILGSKDNAGAAVRTVDQKGQSSGPQPSSSQNEQEGLKGIYVCNLPALKLMSETAQREQLNTIIRQHATVITLSFEIVPAEESAKSSSGNAPNKEGRRALVLIQKVQSMDTLMTTLNLSQMSGSRLKAFVAEQTVAVEAYNVHLAATCATVAGISLPPPPAIPSLLANQQTTNNTAQSSPTAEKKKIISLRASKINSQSSSALLAGKSNENPSTPSSSSGTTSVSSMGYGMPSAVTPDPLHKNASRTLYVGNLERRITDQSLKTRFGCFGHILEVDVKNRDTLSPFAFIQFTNIDSVVAAIRACQMSKSASQATPVNGLEGSSGTPSMSAGTNPSGNSPFNFNALSSGQKVIKTNWGKSICSNKLWIGALPKSCSEEYIFSKMRVVCCSSPDDVTEVIYDPKYNETIVIFKTNEAAQLACTKIKNRVLTFPPEKSQKEGATHVQVDYCSEKLHDFFVDRKFGRASGSSLPPVANSEVITSSNTSNRPKLSSKVVTTTATNQTSSAKSNESTDSLLLAPPPDPPKNLPPISSRKTENASYSDAVIDASNSSGSQNSAIPPDPAMTSTSERSQSGGNHKHNSTSHRKSHQLLSPDPASARQRHDQTSTTSSKHREPTGDKERDHRSASEHTSVRDGRSDRDRRSASGNHSKPQGSRREGAIGESKQHESRQLLPSESGKSKSAHSSGHHQRQATSSSSGVIRDKIRRPTISPSSSGTSSGSTDSDSSTYSDSSSSQGTMTRPRHTWEHRSHRKKRKAKGEKSSSKKVLEKKDSSHRADANSGPKRHTTSSSATSKASKVTGQSRERQNGVTNTPQAKDKMDTLSVNDQGSRRSTTPKSKKNTGIERGPPSPLCPPPPMPNIEPTSTKGKRLHRSERVRDSSATSSSSSASCSIPPEKPPKNEHSKADQVPQRRESAQNIMPDSKESIKLPKPNAILVQHVIPQSHLKQDEDVSNKQQNHQKQTIRTQSTAPTQQASLPTTSTCTTPVSAAPVGTAPLSAPLPSNSSSASHGDTIHRRTSMGAEMVTPTRPAPKQLVRPLTTIPYNSDPTADIMKDPRMEKQKLTIELPESLPLPKFAEFCKVVKERRASFQQPAAAYEDIIQRSPPLSAVMQASMESTSGFFSDMGKDVKPSITTTQTKAKNTPEIKTEELDYKDIKAELCDLEAENAMNLKGTGDKRPVDGLLKKVDHLKNMGSSQNSSMVQRMNQLRSILKNTKENIQNVFTGTAGQSPTPPQSRTASFSAFLSRKPDSFEKELEKIRMKTGSCASPTVDDSAAVELSSLSKRSLSVHIPSTVTSSTFSTVYPQSASIMQSTSSPSSSQQHASSAIPSVFQRGIKNEPGRLSSAIVVPKVSPPLGEYETTLDGSSASSVSTSTPKSSTTTPVSKAMELKPTDSSQLKGHSPSLLSIEKHGTVTSHFGQGESCDKNKESSPTTFTNIGKSTANTAPSIKATQSMERLNESPINTITRTATTHMPPPKDSNRNRILDDLFRQQANDTKKFSATKEKKPNISFAIPNENLPQVQPKDPMKKTSVASASHNTNTSAQLNKTSFDAASVEKQKAKLSIEKHAVSVKKEPRAEESKPKDSQQLQSMKQRAKSCVPPRDKILAKEKPEHKAHNEKERKEEQQKSAKPAKKEGSSKKNKEGSSKSDKTEKSKNKSESKKEKKYKKRQTSRSSDSEEDPAVGSDISESFAMAGIDMEEQRRLLKQIQSGNFGMSMYDRVKRRSSKPKQEDDKKKNDALDQLREKSGKKVKNNRTKRGRSRRSDAESMTADSDDGRMSIASQSTTHTTATSATQKISTAESTTSKKQKKQLSKPEKVPESEMPAKKPSKDESKSKPTTDTKKVKSNINEAPKEQKQGSRDVEEKKPSKKVSEDKKNVKQPLPSPSSSSSASSSSGSDSDGDDSDASSTDGDIFIKKLRKKFSKCRSSSSDSGAAASDDEQSSSANKSKEKEASKEKSSKLAKAKVDIKKQTPQKNTMRLSMDDVFGADSSDDEKMPEKVSNPFQKQETPKQEEKIHKNKEKGKSIPSESTAVAAVKANSQQSAKKPEIVNKTTKKQTDSINALFIKQAQGKPKTAKVTSKERDSISKSTKVHDEPTKRKKKSEEPERTQEHASESKRRKIDVEEEIKTSKKRQAIDTDQDSTTSVKRTKVEPTETKNLAKETKKVSDKPIVKDLSVPLQPAESENKESMHSLQKSKESSAASPLKTSSKASKATVPAKLAPSEKSNGSTSSSQVTSSSSDSDDSYSSIDVKTPEILSHSIAEQLATIENEEVTANHLPDSSQIQQPFAAEKRPVTPKAENVPVVVESTYIPTDKSHNALPLQSTVRIGSPPLSKSTFGIQSSMSNVGISLEENSAVDDVKKLAAELGCVDSSTDFEVIDRGTILSPSRIYPSKEPTGQVSCFTKNEPDSLKSPIQFPVSTSSTPSAVSKQATKRGRPPAGKRGGKTVPVARKEPPKPKTPEAKSKEDIDMDEMEAALMKKMSEEEEMAIMNLTTDADPFGASPAASESVVRSPANTVKETVPEVKPIASEPKEEHVEHEPQKKSEAQKENHDSAAIIKTDTNESETKIDNAVRKAEENSANSKSTKMEPVERRSSNESMESHLGGGGYMEIDAESLLKQQKEQEKLEHQLEMERRRKAEEEEMQARMEETVEAVAAAAATAVRQTSTTSASAVGGAGSDTTSPYHTVHMQSSIDSSRTPQSAISDAVGTDGMTLSTASTMKVQTPQSSAGTNQTVTNLATTPTSSVLVQQAGMPTQSQTPIQSQQHQSQVESQQLHGNAQDQVQPTVKVQVGQPPQQHSFGGTYHSPVQNQMYAQQAQPTYVQQNQHLLQHAAQSVIAPAGTADRYHQQNMMPCQQPQVQQQVPVTSPVAQQLPQSHTPTAPIQSLVNSAIQYHQSQQQNHYTAGQHQRNVLATPTSVIVEEPAKNAGAGTAGRSTPLKQAQQQPSAFAKNVTQPPQTSAATSVVQHAPTQSQQPQKYLIYNNQGTTQEASHIQHAQAHPSLSYMQHPQQPLKQVPSQQQQNVISSQQSVAATTTSSSLIQSSSHIAQMIAQQQHQILSQQSSKTSQVAQSQHQIPPQQIGSQPQAQIPVQSQQQLARPQSVIPPATTTAMGTMPGLAAQEMQQQRMAPSQQQSGVQAQQQQLQQSQQPGVTAVRMTDAPADVNAQKFLAIYNQLNFINPALTMQQQQNAALYSRSLQPNVHSPLAKQWDPTSLELFRQQAAQLQAMHSPTLGSSTAVNVPSNAIIGQQPQQSATIGATDLLLQQQRQAHQQQPQSQHLIQTSALRTAQQPQQQIVYQMQQKPMVAQNQNIDYSVQQVPDVMQQQVGPSRMQSQMPSSQMVIQNQPMGQQPNMLEQPRNPNEKYPVLWQGQLAMKNTDTLVQMHRVCGNEKLIEITNQELVSKTNGISTIRITQRMRLEAAQLETLMKKMEREENYVALVCLPCGRNRDDISVQTSRMTNSFIDYFTSKSAAGIVNQGPHVMHPSCVAHVFPPSEFATGHLTRHAPDLLVTIERHNAGYLFVVITTNN
ncbi:SPOC domain-containing protein [Ditylenchus destructor]|nr:SPOC domain-containing protein [Ditylenchus destructor]